jgi:mannose-1-phosphate guanylyltransferase/mannose-6-phosphate isomerase
MKVLILCGGSGTRLWPLSRQLFPKQFLKLGDKLSFLQKTVKRFQGICSNNDIIFLTNEQHKFLLFEQLSEINFEFNNNFVFEPMSKNTAPAIAIGISFLKEKFKIADNELIFISAADHIIEPENIFIEQLEKAKKIAENNSIVTFGIEPNFPETGYGYIKKGKKLDYSFDAYKVETFVEKPNRKTAINYLKTGDYLWNSGMFMFSYKTIVTEYEKNAQKIFKYLKQGYENLLTHFKNLPNISIDYAIMEKAQSIAVVPLNLKWSDIGSWDSVHQLFSKDPNGNVLDGNTICFNTKNSLIIGKNRLITTIGLEDVMVIETDDAILISKKGDAQQVKNIVDKLKTTKDLEEITKVHTLVNRPWGSFKILDEEKRHKIKKIIVKPGETLSLQMHFHRSEHWIVVKGTAKVIIDDKEYFIHENESIYVPKSTKHRLENPGKIPLEIIEVQVGEYVGEDDIKRFEDIYGRK